MSYSVYKGDTDPPLVIPLTVAGDVPDDLAGATARVSVRYEGTPTLLVNNAVANLNTTTGLVTYPWTAGQTITPGELVAWAIITKSTGRIQQTPTVRFAIVDHDAAEPTGHYTTPNRVRDELDTSDADLSDDDALALIGIVEDVTDSLLGARAPNTTTGRKVVEADVEAWQWAKLQRFATLLAAEAYRDESVLHGWQYRTVSGPEFSFSGPRGNRIPDHLIGILNASGLRVAQPIQSVPMSNYGSPASWERIRGN